MTPALGIPPLFVGSGKFGTPCERIQEEYATSPVESVLPLADELAVVVVVEPVAALGVDGPPPQAATATPTARIPAVTNAAQRDRGGRLGSRQESGEMSFCCVMSCITPPGSRRCPSVPVPGT
jgi:hypothetical protein